MLFSRKHDLCIWLMMKADKENREKILKVLELSPDYFFNQMQIKIDEHIRSNKGEKVKFTSNYDKYHYHLNNPPYCSYYNTVFNIICLGGTYLILDVVRHLTMHNTEFLFSLKIDSNNEMERIYKLRHLGSIIINCGSYFDEIEKDRQFHYGDEIHYYSKETSLGILLISFIQRKKGIGTTDIPEPKKELYKVTIIKYQDIPLNKDISIEALRELCNQGEEKCKTRKITKKFNNTNIVIKE